MYVSAREGRNFAKIYGSSSMATRGDLAHARTPTSHARGAWMDKATPEKVKVTEKKRGMHPFT